MIIITFDEAQTCDKRSSSKDDIANDTCESKGPNRGVGGGRVGALVISQLVTPCEDRTDYNHYALLRSVEDLFVKDAAGKKKHLGLAEQPGLKSFNEVPGFYRN